MQFLFARLEKGKSVCCLLVEQAYLANRTMQSTLSLTTEETVKRKTVKKYKNNRIVSTFNIFTFVVCGKKARV